MKYIFFITAYLSTFSIFLGVNAINYPLADIKKGNRMKHKEEFEIPLTEDLMREHGVLNRVLLIYEEIVRSIDTHKELPLSALRKSLDIIQLFIEQYHEKLEENYIFPLFEAKKVKVKLVRALKKQHIKGREITSKLQTLSATKNQTIRTKTMIKSFLQKFIKMYRPHEAREDTELFPLVRSLISKQRFEELSETFEELEHTLFGKNGFDDMVKKVTAIEKELGIYQLEQFTPS